MEQVHALQDAIKVSQKSAGKFEIPNWDPDSHKKVREAILVLAATLPDSKKMFGTKQAVDPIRFLLGVASGWGGNPDKDAAYILGKPPKDDGEGTYKLTVKNVPVNGFWSVSVYNAQGFFEKNASTPIRSTISPARRIPMVPSPFSSEVARARFQIVSPS